MERMKTRPSNRVKDRLPWINCKPYLAEQIPVLDKPNSKASEMTVSTGIYLSSASSIII